MEHNAAIRLENWCIVNSDPDPYQPPERQKKRLHGKVFGHPNFDDGEEITTSSISSFHNGVVLTSSGSQYRLGEVDPGYENEYPNAYQRLFGTNSHQSMEH